MKTLRECIKEAEAKGVALGHFNIANLEGFHAVYRAAKKLGVPVIIGLSEGEEDFVGREEAVALVRTIRERGNYPIFLNADHHYSLESVKNAIDAGFDAVIIDGAKLPLEENIILTKKCVEYTKGVNTKDGRDILVEAEIGFIGVSSKILDAIPEGISETTMTSGKDAEYFVSQTGVDLLAPSVGNIHGMVKGGNPRLHPERVKEIRQAAGVPLVLHGGSGITDEDFTNAIEAGVAIIHISTELRLAYSQALKKSLAENPDELAPYKILQPAVAAMEAAAEARLKLFNGR